MIVQTCIIVFSCASIAAFSSPRWFRWGFILGLCGQPFWFISAWQADQWGVLAVAAWYTISHVRGIYKHSVRG